MSLEQLVKRAEKLVVDNSPTILTSIGVTGSATTAYLAARASFRAAAVISDYEEQIKEGQRANLIPDFSTKEKIQATWKLYIPAIGTGVLTIAAIIAANRIGMRRTAALAAAYSLSERALTEYKTKIVEKVGETKERQARDELAQDRVNAKPVSTSEVIITENGEVLCYDSITGRYFTSDMEKLRKAQNDVNSTIISNYYASLNDFFRAINLPTTSYGEEVGWNADSLLEVQYSAVLSEGGKPCISLDYRVYPVRDYHRLQ